MAINAIALAAAIKANLDTSLGAAAPAQDAARASLAASIATPVANAHNADGGAGGSFVDAETPTGIIDGVNATFGLAFTPITGSLHLYLNGVRLRPGTDFTLTTATITMAMVPQTGDWLYADYRK